MYEHSGPEPGALDLPDLDVVIAVHDVRRRVDRAVASVLGATRAKVRVTVVGHGVQEAEVRAAIGAEDSRLRVVSFTDGVHSPGGPFNYGLALASGTFVAVLGSDDFLDPGAVDAWVGHVRRNKTDYLMAPVRHQSGRVWRDPLTRPGRTRALDPVADRLNYRTAPLGLIRRSYLAARRMLLTEGVATGVDVEMGLALANGGGRIDFDPALPAYVIGEDALAPVGAGARSLAEEFGALERLARVAWIGELDVARRRAIAIKLWRVNVVPAVVARAEPAEWTAEDLDCLARVAAWLTRLAPDATESLSRCELFVVRAAPSRSAQAVTAAARRARAATRRDKLFTQDVRRVLDRDTVARRRALLCLPGGRGDLAPRARSAVA